MAKIAVIGTKTSEEVIKYNLTPYLISNGNTSIDLLNEFIPKTEPTDRILLVLGELADNTLEKGIIHVASITRLNVYKTLHPAENSAEIIDRIKKNEYNIILFTSPSGFSQFKKIMPEKILSDGFKSACIGRTTEKAMAGSKFIPLLVSRKSDGEFFVNELELFFNKNKI